VKDRADATSPDNAAPEGTTPADTSLDRMLSAHFASELDAHLGSALRRFENFSDAPLRMPAAETARAGAGPSFTWLRPLLIAACVALAALPALRFITDLGAAPSQRATGERPLVQNRISPQPLAPVRSDNALAAVQNDAQLLPVVLDEETPAALWWEYRDAGKVYLDDQTVAQQVLTTEYRRLNFVDPTDKTRIEITVPRQEVVLISAPKF
jgi:hypothetical protein